MNDATLSQTIQEINFAADMARYHMADQLNMGTNDLIALHHLVLFGEMQPAQLAKRLRLTTAATTTLLDRLEDMGHVVRTPHPSDRRRQIVSPTDHAQSEAGKALGPLIEDICILHSQMKDTDKKIVNDYLQKLSTIYKDYTKRL